MKARITASKASSHFDDSSLKVEAEELLEGLRTVAPWAVQQRFVELLECLNNVDPKDLLSSAEVNITQKKYAVGLISKDEAISELDRVLTKVQSKYPGHITLLKLADSES